MAVQISLTTMYVEGIPLTNRMCYVESVGTWDEGKFPSARHGDILQAVATP